MEKKLFNNYNTISSFMQLHAYYPSMHCSYTRATQCFIHFLHICINFYRCVVSIFSQSLQMYSRSVFIFLMYVFYFKKKKGQCGFEPLHPRLYSCPPGYSVLYNHFLFIILYSVWVAHGAKTLISHVVWIQWPQLCHFLYIYVSVVKVIQPSPGSIACLFRLRNLPVFDD